jgi:hypothetical protein
MTLRRNRVERGVDWILRHLLEPVRYRLVGRVGWCDRCKVPVGRATLFTREHAYCRDCAKELGLWHVPDDWVDDWPPDLPRP